jgi:hypothetical protein
MKMSVKVWEKNDNALSIERGPLTYSLKIGERWHRFGGTDLWPAYEVFPTTPWNYGLVVDPMNPAASFKVVRSQGALPEQPFALDNAPIYLEVQGKRIPQWRQESNGLVGSLQASPVRSDQRPAGCEHVEMMFWHNFELVGGLTLKTDQIIPRSCG